jgi:hypothetical protein
MLTIDLHAHYGPGRGYLDRLLRAMDAAGIERVCLSAFAPHFGWERGNADVADALRQHPDRVIGYAFIRPGWDGVDEIRRWHEEGMRAVKVTCPRENYDHRGYYPLWREAEECGLPVLFHTGIVTLPDATPGEDISSVRMRPIFLEPISRAFPDLVLICAHLGIHWNMEAAELLRMRPNIYADLTGEPGGYRERLLPRLREYLWWPGAFERLVFGTDVDPDKIEHNMEQDRRVLRELGVPAQTQARYFHGNAAAILGLDEEG